MNKLSFYRQLLMMMACILCAAVSTAFAQDNELDPALDPEMELETTEPKPAAPAAPQPPGIPSLRPTVPELFPETAQADNTRKQVDLWDGVDDKNNLCVFVNNMLVLDDVGNMSSTPFPPSPNFVDINDNGLKDLIVGDSYGFVWIYLNSGEPGKPKFTTGQFLHTFTGWGSRVHVADWNQNGLYDLIIGTFYGDICIVENTGTRQEYRFTRAMGIPRYVSPRDRVDDDRARLPQVYLGKEPMILGIYMAPWIFDWNNNQRPDLIFGEGTYSANSVRIAFNRGPRGRPTFVEDSLFFLAFGEGAEQLTPAVVDYNGDGINDLIVGTRTGQIRLYKGTTDTIDPKDTVAALRSTLAPAILEFDGILQIEDKDVWDTMTYVYPCDWNENGLFDLLLGSTSGRIYIALNEGTKEKPHFPKAVPVKGTNVRKDRIGPDAWSMPIGGYDHRLWSGRHFHGFANAAVLLTAEEEVVLTPGANPIKPTVGERFLYFRYIDNYIGWTRRAFGEHVQWITGGRSIRLVGHTLKMEIGKRYELSFDSILLGKPAEWRMRASETLARGTDTTPPQWEWRHISDTLRPSGSWQRRTYTFTCPGVGAITNELSFNFWFYLPDGESTLLLDNFSLKERRR